MKRLFIKLRRIILRNRKITIGILLGVLIVISGIIIIYGPASYLAEAPKESIKLRVKKGDGLNQVASYLEESGFLQNKLTFKLYVFLVGNNIKAGLYEIKPGFSIYKITYILNRGLSLSEDIVVTIPEGSNINDIDKKFALAGLTKPGDFLDAETIKSEGFLFPDTYRFLPGTTKEEIIETLRDNFDEKTKKVWGDRIFSSRKLQEVVIKASIIEKEVRIEKEMKLVASVIENRLNINKPLQIDATVAYGVCREDFLVGKNCETSQVNLIKAIREQSPFNSYKNKDLPPAPIANPGLQSINAVLNPAESDYFYYLTGRDGITRFSKTATEHEAKRKEFR